MDIKQLVGLRTLKTGLAVTLASLLGLTPFIVSPFFSIISACLALQNTVKNSFDIGKDRVLGTILGAVLGFVAASLYMGIPSHFQALVVGLAIVTCILLCNHFKLGSGLMITLTVCVSIIVGEEAGDLDLMAATVFRATDTLIGILISLGINYFIKPPNYWSDFSEEMERIDAIATGFFKNILVHQKFQLEELSKELDQLDKIYTRINADRKFLENPLSAKKLKEAVNACHDIYFHAKSLSKLEADNQLYIEDENRRQIYQIFSGQQDIQPGAACSIFEYHIYQMLSQMRLLHRTMEKMKKGNPA